MEGDARPARPRRCASRRRRRKNGRASGGGSRSPVADGGSPWWWSQLSARNTVTPSVGSRVPNSTTKVAVSAGRPGSAGRPRVEARTEQAVVDRAGAVGPVERGRGTRPGAELGGGLVVVGGLEHGEAAERAEPGVDVEGRPPGGRRRGARPRSAPACAATSWRPGPPNCTPVGVGVLPAADGLGRPRRRRPRPQNASSSAEERGVGRVELQLGRVEERRRPRRSGGWPGRSA